jgi:muramoyltetrapeptide carboxypeptidase
MMAGTDSERLADLTWALTAPDLDAAWMARGGYGLTRLLSGLDFSDVANRPVIGFSDGTALQVALLQEAGLQAVHGPVLHSLAGHTDKRSRQILRDLLAGRGTAGLRGRVLVPGSAAGPVVGGNLCLIAATCGTPWQLRAQGCLLLLEEIGEPAYRLDRLLQQLKSAGVLDGVRGVGLGALKDCRIPDGLGCTVEDLFLDHLAPLGVPVVAGLPFGHGPENHAWVHGGSAALKGPELNWHRGLG